MRILIALRNRLNKYDLKMNAEKIKLVEFDKTKDKPDTFDFLNFTFCWGKSKKGFPILKDNTAGKRFRTKHKRVIEW